MEKTIKKIKIPVHLVIVILILIAAVAAGVYFFTSGTKDKQPSRGTYVIMNVEKG